MKKTFLTLNLDKNEVILREKNKDIKRYYYFNLSYISINKIENNLYINIYELNHLYFELFYIKLKTKNIYIYASRGKSLIIIDDYKRYKYDSFNIHNKYYYKEGYIKIYNIKENITKRINDLKYSTGILNLEINNLDLKDKIFIKDIKFFFIKRMYD